MKRLDGLEGMLAKLDAAVRQYTEELNEAKRTPEPAAVTSAYIQNTTSAAVHTTRKNNPAQTICG